MTHKIGDIVYLDNNKEPAKILDIEKDDHYEQKLYHIEIIATGHKLWIGELYLSTFKTYNKKDIDCDCGAKYTQDVEHQHFRWCKSTKMEVQIETINGDSLNNEPRLSGLTWAVLNGKKFLT